MKSLVTIIAIIIVGYLGYTFLNTQDNDSAPQDTATEAETTTPETNADSTADSTAEEADDSIIEADIEIAAETEGEIREFTLDAFNFGYSETELRVNTGDTVVITLTNSDGFHDWVLDEFDVATEQIQAGDTATVTFVADEAGSYEYYCSVGAHRAQGMVGTLIVE